MDPTRTYSPGADLIPRFGIFKSIFNVCISFSGGRGDRGAGQNSNINPRAVENHQFDPRVKGSRLGLGWRREVAKILLAFYSFWSGL